MATTFGDLWRRVRLYVPMAPALLIQDWVTTAYQRACDERSWSFLRGEGEFRINPSKSGTVNLTQDSPTVAGAGGASGLVFAASDLYRQFRYGGGPPLTIIAVNLAGNTSATLERNWQGTSATAVSATVSDIYATCPADFGHFAAVLDVAQQRLIRIFTTELELNAADPGRMALGTPWALVNYRLSSIAATLGLVQYEWWPYTSGSGTLRYPFYYIKRPQALAEDDTFQGPLKDRPDVLVTGALAEAAEWPGTETQRNPYFNLNTAAAKRKQFEYAVGLLEVKDEETYMTWWQTAMVGRWGMQPLTPVDARFAQSHE